MRVIFIDDQNDAEILYTGEINTVGKTMIQGKLSAMVKGKRENFMIKLETEIQPEITNER